MISEEMASIRIASLKREVVSPEGVLPPLARTVQVISKGSGVRGSLKDGREHTRNEDIRNVMVS
jgi:hypothetical protein